MRSAARALDHLVGYADHGGLTAYVLSVHYALAFAIGAVLARHRVALCQRYRALPGRTRVVLGVLTFLLYVDGSQAMHIFGLDTLMPYDWPLIIGAALLLISGAAEPVFRRWLETPVLLYLGRISYSLYLFHLIVLLATLHPLAHRLPLGMVLALTLVASFVMADLAYRRLDRPAIGLSKAAGQRVAAIQRRCRPRTARARLQEFARDTLDYPVLSRRFRIDSCPRPLRPPDPATRRACSWPPGAAR